jgi:nitroreductase
LAARLLVSFLPVFVAIAASAQPAGTIPLPSPRTTGGKPLMQALGARHSAREFSPETLPPQVLSDLLWAAWGISRPDGRRTAPSARNWQETDVYVALAEGGYLYDPKAHALRLVLAEDARAATGAQPFVALAPVNLVYVADAARAGEASHEDRAMYYGAHAGFISQNVYLFCASEGLATVVRASLDRAALARRLKLRPEQHITLVQTVGYSKKP